MFKNCIFSDALKLKLIIRLFLYIKKLNIECLNSALEQPVMPEKGKHDRKI